VNAAILGIAVHGELDANDLAEVAVHHFLPFDNGIGRDGAPADRCTVILSDAPRYNGFCENCADGRPSESDLTERRRPRPDRRPATEGYDGPIS
jgi:hypothetical protein